MIKLTPPQHTASSIRASDVALLKAAMEKRGFTASEADIEYVYSTLAMKMYGDGWVNLGFWESVDVPAKRIIRWMRNQWWVETNV